MTVVPGSAQSTITYTIPGAWLTDPARVFPVTIDPSVLSLSATDTYISDGHPDTCYGSSPTLLIGMYRHGGGSCQTLVEFPAALSTIPESAHISAAAFNIYQYHGGRQRHQRQPDDRLPGAAPAPGTRSRRRSPIRRCLPTTPSCRLAGPAGWSSAVVTSCKAGHAATTPTTAFSSARAASAASTRPSMPPIPLCDRRLRCSAEQPNIDPYSRQEHLPLGRHRSGTGQPQRSDRHRPDQLHPRWASTAPTAPRPVAPAACWLGLGTTPTPRRPILAGARRQVSGSGYFAYWDSSGRRCRTTARTTSRPTGLTRRSACYHTPSDLRLQAQRSR